MTAQRLRLIARWIRKGLPPSSPSTDAIAAELDELADELPARNKVVPIFSALDRQAKRPRYQAD